MSVRREYVRGDETVAVVVESQGDDRYRVRVGGKVLLVRALPLDAGGVRILPLDEAGNVSDASACTAFGAPSGASFQVRIQGHTWTLEPPERRRGAPGRCADGTVRAPMVGTVAKVLCKAGDAVEADQTLVVLTAMKMEHKLSAGRAGTVQSVTTVEGATVDQGAVLVVVAETGGGPS